MAAVLRKGVGSIQSGRVALGGVAPIPWFEEDVSNSLTGMILSESGVEQLVAGALQKAEPLEMNEYKLPLARNLIRRLISELMI